MVEVHIPISTDREIRCAIGEAADVDQPDTEKQNAEQPNTGQPNAGQPNTEQSSEEQQNTEQPNAEQSNESQDSGVKGNLSRQKVQSEIVPQQKVIPETGKPCLEEVNAEAKADTLDEGNTKQEADAEVKVEQEATAPEIRGQSMAETLKARKVTTKDSKWNQLWEIYPHINPFRDEREYLSVGPNDFVVLSEKCYRLIHNSFLLHGFYNYHHLTLQKRSNSQGKRYYIGVPGNFYEKEKQVAVMFGFESFECKEEPAKEGDFGYYMISVDL